MLIRKQGHALAFSLILIAGCGGADSSEPPAGSGGAGVKVGTGGTTASVATGGAGSTPTTGTGGQSSTPAGSGGGASTASGGSGPASSNGGGTTTATGGRGGATVGAGGRAAAATGGSSVGAGGGPIVGGGGRSGSAGGATATPGTGGAVVAGVKVSATCKQQTWPTSVGAQVNISGTRAVTGVYDGKMAVHEGTLEDCSKGDQSSTEPMFEVANGGTVRNVIFGNNVGDGIHCLGSCTIENVWFPFVCDDAVSALGDGATVTISNSGFKNARDKMIQANGNNTTVSIDNVYAETAGKLVRSCGEGGGCGPASSKRTFKVSNVVAVGLSTVVGISSNDTATLTNICGYRTPQVCHVYQPGSDNDATVGANGVGEGPSANCIYKGSDSHALVDRVTGNFPTDVLCPGPNAVKTGATATACVTGFDSCLKTCAPGGYGFKAVACTAGKYADGGAAACAMPADATIAAKFASSNSTTATNTVTGNGTCSTLWQWGKDSSARFCMCVLKPGYYQQSSTAWTVWDCQTPWY